MTPAEVHALAAGAGLAADSAVIATAVSWAEIAYGDPDPDLDPGAVGDEDLVDDIWGPSIGLWQIRSLHAHSGTGKERDALRLPDPEFNARSMATISKGGTDWTPWSVWKNGRYAHHLDDVVDAIEPAGGPMEIVARAEWGARPASGMALASYPMTRLWLHHSDTVPTDDPAADMRLLQQIGVSRGFADVSYTFALHPDGTILEGRDLRYVGAHTAGNNSTSLAFVLIGNYDRTPPTAAQVASARWLRDHLVDEGYLTPGTYPTGGHQDAPGNATGCPGAAAEARLDLFRAPQDDLPPSTPDDPPKEDDMASPFVLLTYGSGVALWHPSGDVVPLSSSKQVHDALARGDVVMDDLTADQVDQITGAKHALTIGPALADLVRAGRGDGCAGGQG